MTEIDFGAFGLVNNVHDVTIRNNEFNNVGYDRHAHHIYNAHNVSNVLIEHNTLIDSTGDYIRLRDDNDHTTIRHNTFRSTGGTWNKPFIAMTHFNNDEDNPDEVFATNIAIHHNSFEYPFTQWTSPNSALRNTDAILFSHYGYSPPEWDYLMTAQEGWILQNGTPQQIYDLLLENTGLDGEKIFISDNELTNVYEYILFGSFAHYGAESGWEGWADISSIVQPIPEPGTLAIFGAAALGLLRRRRQRAAA